MNGTLSCNERAPMDPKTLNSMKISSRALFPFGFRIPNSAEASEGSGCPRCGRALQGRALAARRRVLGCSSFGFRKSEELET